ncbi:MAG: selenocysteine-specific translation elongation factor [Desulfobulbaceae bacterium]|uniref:Selenocysteine-specific elongation factor n=1 Tax=Candidatus Desulfobia pelagia TaxID=2841692 RepID=A0A8J6TAW7_9BACT|nr:selenocysteine-specific translation elongation factor [Candidatus Desulfobia pelagia]
MREIVLGTAGHVDHGKTSLVRALTGIDTDRLKEEKKRGITIELGFAYLDLPCGHRVGVVDVPGHERFVKNMVAGAAGIDLVAFVIAADEGIMPQTREHFEICHLLGIQNGFIVITKADMVEPEWLELVQEEVREYFAGSFLEGVPMVTVSSTKGTGISDVRDLLDKMVSTWEFTEAYGPFRLSIDRIFNMKGFGSVITGTSLSGRIGIGDDVLIYPQLKQGKIRGIQVHGKSVDMVEAGNRTAINLQGLEKEMINRGDVLASPGCLRSSYILDAGFLYLSTNEKPLKNRTRIRVHLGTKEIMGRVVLLEDDELTPGKETNIQILLEEPVSVWADDYYVIRSYSPVATIGGGKIFNGCAIKRKRFREQNKQAFQIYRKGSLEERIQFHVMESDIAGITEDDLAVRMGMFGNRFKKILSGPISARKIVVVDSDQQLLVDVEVYDRIREGICEQLSSYHTKSPLKLGMAKEELRNLVNPGLGAKLFQLCLNDLTRKGRIAQEEGVIRLAEHQVSLKADEKVLRKDMEKLFSDAGLTAPTIKEVLSRFSDAPKQLVRDVLSVLVKENLVTKVTDDLYFSTSSLMKLESDLIGFLEKEGEIDAPRFKDLTGLTRKFSIPLLEYFDKIKLTLRVGDKRILRKKK